MINNVIYLTKKRIKKSQKKREVGLSRIKDKLTNVPDFSIIAEKNFNIKVQLKKERELTNRQVLKSYRIK